MSLSFLVAYRPEAGASSPSSGRRNVNNWSLKALDLEPRLPEILSSTSEGRAVALDPRAGESSRNMGCMSGRGS